ncbi:hypothetical protein JCM19235_3921 [Vibrio maritimus]|uniref:Uncharacterized protein n=1 Tax=Vibrio maritimus TaxID=990268 RepID=A0A090S3X1_9VIBR|nr:hypothetical protein JCM19235_3921 [Vibrio maritimus]
MSDGKESSIVSGVNVNVAQKSAVKPNKWLERTLILLALVGTFAVVGLYQDLFGRVHQQINLKRRYMVCGRRKMSLRLPESRLSSEKIGW